MTKIIFNTRDELILFDIDKIALVQANGNYSRIINIRNRVTTVTMGISRVESALKDTQGTHRFLRLGRSLIVNHSLLYRIDVLKGLLVLSDGEHELRITASKDMLKSYKNAVEESMKPKENKRNDYDNEKKNITRH